MKTKRQINLANPLALLFLLLFVFLPLELIGFRLNKRIGATKAEQIATNIIFYASKNLIFIFNAFCIYENYF